MIPHVNPDNWCRECRVHVARYEDGYLCPVCIGESSDKRRSLMNALGWRA